MIPLDSSLEEFIGKDIADRYRCLMKLGSGGMGVVFLAEDLLLAKTVVMKIFISPATSLYRIFREANILSQLNHPRIVTIMDFGLWNNVTYIVMEYLEGEDLKNLLEKDAPLPTEKIMDILAEIMEALEAAHQAGIIHRDLKPGNIFCLSKSGEEEHIKILDFGLAQSFLHSDDVTKAKEITGTPHYMSPEQILGEKPLSVESDIYSLGVILYEMLSGAVPMNGKNTIDIFLEHLYKPPPLFPDDSEDDDPLRIRLQKVSLTCLSKDTKDRYDSIQALRHDITSKLPLKGWTERVKIPTNLMRRQQIRIHSQGFSIDTKNFRHFQDMFFMVLEDVELPVGQALTPMLHMLQYNVRSYSFLAWKKFKLGEYPDVIFLNSGQNNNLTIIDALKNTEHWNTIPIIVCCPADDDDYVRIIIEAGASDFLSYPFNPGDLSEKLNKLLG